MKLLALTVMATLVGSVFMGQQAHAELYVFGTSGFDNLKCGYGDCVITGYNPQHIKKDKVGDILTGGINGTDFIIGGGGADVLTGGTGGANAFLYNFESDSTPTAPDEITNFNADVDVLGLAGPVWHRGLTGEFIGQEPFSGKAGQVRFHYVYQPNGVVRTIVTVDLTGKKQADMQIDLDGQIDLESANILFTFPDEMAQKLKGILAPL